MGELEDEFRPLFMEEAKGHLERIASGLLTLEAAPDDQTAIDAIFREAHTMKGAAGMVGMMRVSRLAHRLEDLLVELKDKKRMATPELIDAMLLVVDGLGRLIASASGSEQDSSDEAALERLLPNLPATVAAAPKPVLPPPPIVAAPPPAPTFAAATAVLVAPAAQASADVPAAAVPSATPPAGQPPRRPLDQPRHESATLEVPVARIDELNRLVGEASAAQLRVGHIFGSEMHRDPEGVTEYRELTKVINQLQEVTERTRMVPVATLEPILHRTVRDSARAAGKDVRWEMLGEDIEVDRGVLEQLVSPLLHLVRNSVGHGVELPEVRVAAGKPPQATVRLQASQVGSKVVIAISDDGAGINVAAVRASAAKSGVDVSALTEQQSLQLIFRSGISTAKVLTEESGRGVGLDVVATAVAAVHGAVEVVNHPGSGAEFRIVVPITLTVVACLIVSIAGQSFALPLHRIIRMLDAQHIQVVSGRKLAVIDGVAVPVSNLGTLLGLPTSDEGPWVLLGTPASAHAFQIETVLQKRDVVVRGLTGRLRDLKAINGASIEPNGSILLVLDVPMLIELSDTLAEHASRVTDKAAGPARQLSVMVVDDALMVRELQRSILERGGYAVRTASDGAEALTMLADQPADLVVTDLEMPNLDGFALTSSIRAHPRLANIPVLIVSSRASAEDHQRGLDAGADGYIVKTSFDEAGLLSAVSRLLGRELPTMQRPSDPAAPVWIKADLQAHHAKAQ
ncbi:MAG: two-component system, chemotaxis family, sensor kinase CheA [Chloroflexota bacterium]|nr:two-component system, chemotaxis family, sensor kinase CheA [Chloroflexota bacterium]